MSGAKGSGEYSVDGDRRTRKASPLPAFIKSLRTPLTTTTEIVGWLRLVDVVAVLGFAFGYQKIILDWVDPSDLFLGLFCVILGWMWLNCSGWLRTPNRIYFLFLFGFVYTTLDYLTGIGGYPWHYWNQL